jgi:acetyl-CoA carboxylase biotin carboxyl carrier protein
VADDALLAVKAPMSGVFYRFPAPDQPAFVETGTRVRKGQTLALLESMKLFTKIKAPTDGVVAEVCVLNEQAVSVGETLFRLERQ